MRLIALIPVMLVLTACGPAPLKMELGVALQPGAFQVVGLEVIPENPTVAADPDFPIVQPLLVRELQTRLTGKGVGKTPVVLSVRVSGVQLMVSTAQVILIGDSYNISSTFQLQDPQTRRTLATSLSYNAGAGRGGIIGLIGDASYSQESKVQSLVEEHAARIVEGLYPEK